mmetsp:Transcript_24413/g.75283  ORF Transcript_24413/g.75283 Transcript_24413/m.75283 type:complete len:285 (+) Transcript_24413:897-1751(+)
MASVQSDMSRDIALAQQNASSVAVGLDGRTHKGDELAAALRALDPLTPVDGCDKFCRAVDGLAQPNSLTGILEVADLDGNVTRLFLKKVTAAAMAHKGWNDRRRSLLYARNELRIYREFPELAARGVGHPRVLRLTDGLSALDEERLGGDVGAEPPTEALSSCGVILWLEPVVGYSQLSPLAPKQAAVVLRAAARLHAATWEDAALLTRSADRLQHPGGSFALAIRNPAELDRIEQNWETFKRNFREAAPSGFFRAPGIAALGARARRPSGTNSLVLDSLRPSR